MIRTFILVAALVVVAGCNSEGSAEANGQTKSLSQEIPAPKEQEKTFTPPGHSLLKEGPPGGGGGKMGDATTPPAGGATPPAGGDEKVTGEGVKPDKEATTPKKGGM